MHNAVMYGGPPSGPIGKPDIFRRAGNDEVKPPVANAERLLEEAKRRLEEVEKLLAAHTELLKEKAILQGMISGAQPLTVSK